MESQVRCKQGRGMTTALAPHSCYSCASPVHTHSHTGVTCHAGCLPMTFPGFRPQSRAGVPVVVSKVITSDMSTPTYIRALPLRSVSGNDPHSSTPDNQGTCPPPPIRLDSQESQTSHFFNFQWPCLLVPDLWPWLGGGFAEFGVGGKV